MFYATLGGHLGKDPESRFAPNGDKVTSFTVAINQRKGKEDVTIWVRVSVWGNRFDKIIDCLKKGSGVIVSGKMKVPSIYEDKEGRTQVTFEIQAEMIDFPFSNRGTGDQVANTSTSFSRGGNSQDASQSSQYDEGQFQMHQANQYNKMQTSYGSQTTSQGNRQSQTIDEDALPF